MSFVGIKNVILLYKYVSLVCYIVNVGYIIFLIVHKFLAVAYGDTNANILKNNFLV